MGSMVFAYLGLLGGITEHTRHGLVLGGNHGWIKLMAFLLINFHTSSMNIRRPMFPDRRTTHIVSMTTIHASYLVLNKASLLYFSGTTK